MKHHISVSGINVEVVRKDIKNLHIGFIRLKAGCE